MALTAPSKPQPKGSIGSPFKPIQSANPATQKEVPVKGGGDAINPFAKLQPAAPEWGGPGYIDPNAFSGGGGGYGGGGGGGGAGGGGGVSLINQQRDDLINRAKTRYNDTLAELGGVESGLRKESDMSRDMISKNQEQALLRAEQQRVTGGTSARDNYQDLTLETRRRARAAGGGASSGFQELTNKLDVTLQRNLQGIDTSVNDYSNTVKTTATQALNELQINMDKALQAIAKDKTMALRDRDNAIKDIEMSAAEKAMQISSWARSGGGGGSRGGGGKAAAGGAAAYGKAVTAQYLSDLAKAQAGQLGKTTAAQVQASYAPQLAQAGVNPGTASSYGQMVGYNPNAGKQDMDFAMKFYDPGYGFDEENYNNFLNSFGGR